MSTVQAPLTFGGMAIYVDDVRGVMDFYKRAFGFETRYFDPEYEYGELTTGGDTHLGIASHKLGRFVMPGRYEPSKARDLFAFEIGFFTDDVAGAFARAVREGAAVVAGPKTMPWGGTIAYVRDIAGTLIVICTPVSA